MLCRTGGQLGVRTKPAGKAWPGPDIWPPEGLFCDGDRTPDECGVTTPDPHLEELRLYDSWDRGGRSGGGLGGFHLPSHISAFGDGLRLPSYISAFGDGVRCCMPTILRSLLPCLAVLAGLLACLHVWRQHQVLCMLTSAAA